MMSKSRPYPEQHAAGDPTHSVWVAASAGSGKTHVLVDRLLRLLLAGSEPARLMCVTFTKAAAAEMAERLHRELSAWAKMEDAPLTIELEARLDKTPDEDMLALSRRLFARVLDTPGGLKIQTLHSFCESLLGRFPLEARIAPHFEVVDERTSAEVLTAARDRVLEQGAADETSPLGQAIAIASQVTGETGFEKMIDWVVGQRGKLGRMFDRDGGLDGAVAHLAESLDVDAEDSEESVIAALCAESAVDAAGLRAAAGVLSTGSNTDKGRGAEIGAWLSDSESRIAGFDQYCGQYLNKKGYIRKTLATKKVVDANPDAFAVLEAEAERIRAGQERILKVKLFDRSRALLTLATAVLSAFEIEKRRHNRLDYEDLIQRTRDLLSQPDVAPWVLFKLDGGIDHILVDEAQDTSPDQWEIVSAIANEFFVGEGASEKKRTLFVVGDEKQSIYSFQGADPLAFDTMRKHFQSRAEESGRPWREVSLARSFRSVPAVLAAVDAVFAQQSARAGVTTSGHWENHEANRFGQAGEVIVWPTVSPTDLDAIEAWSVPLRQETLRGADTILAKRIADTISGWITNKEKLVARDRPIRPGDVMILVRRRNEFFAEMVNALKRAGLAVAGIDRMVLNEQLAVMDMIALGRFALLPTDDLNLAVVLKSPLIGFDDERLFDLAWKRKGSLWDALIHAQDREPEFAAAYEYLAGLLASADFMPPFDWFAGILTGGARQKILARLGTEADDPLDEFLSMALVFERDHVPSLEGFLFWLEVGDAQVKRDMDQGRDEIRVMTIHGAKGLQAPIVFLPDTTGLPPGPGGLQWSADGDDGLPLWLGNSGFDLPETSQLRQEMREKELREYRRLLYVAMTRAEDRLYLCGWDTTRTPAGNWYELFSGGLDEVAEPVELPFSKGAATGRRLQSPQTEPVEEKPEASETALAADMPDWAFDSAAEERPSAKTMSPSRLDQDDLPGLSPLVGDDGARFRRGNAIHRLLEVLPDIPPENRARAAQAYLSRDDLGFTADEATEIADETMHVLTGSEFAEAFGPGSLAEVPIAGKVGDIVISGQIDRLVISKDQILIVDYKTNRDPPKSQKEIPESYIRQMAAYRAALTEIYREVPVRCALLWTSAAVLMEIDNDRLAKALS